jgi:hypothetical protein
MRGSIASLIPLTRLRICWGPEGRLDGAHRLVRQACPIGDADAHRRPEAPGAREERAQARHPAGGDEEDQRPGGLGIDEGVEERELANALRSLKRPVQAHGTAEVVHGETDLLDAERAGEPVQGAREEPEAVGGVERLIGQAEAGQVGGDDAVALGDDGKDVAPEKG